MSARHQLAAERVALKTDGPHIEQEARLYGGQFTIQLGTFGRQRHAYYCPEKDVFIPGATTILSILDKPALLNWAAKAATDHVRANLPEGADKATIERVCDEAKGAHTRLKDAGADIGSQVHDFAQRLFEGKPVELPSDPAAQRGIKAIQEWIAGNNVMPIDVERIVFSQSAFFAGKFDLLANVNGKLSLCDIKTSSGVYKEHKLQLGGYRYAWEEENKGERIEQLVIIHADKKTGKVKPYHYDDPAEIQFYTDTFLRVKAVSENIRKMGDY